MDAMDAAELERLREVERRLTAITAHAPDFILHFDRQGVISYMNRPAPGHQMADMLGTNVRRWMEPAHHEAFGRAVDQVFETGALSSYESVGSVTGRIYVNRISPVLSDGQVSSAVLITHDITDLKEAESRARESEQRYRALVEASFEGLAISIDQVLLDCNQVLADMFGYPLEEMIGLSPAELCTPESQAVVARNYVAGIETPYEVVAVRRDGSTFPCELLGRNMVYREKPARITGFRDLTERRRQEAEQERQEEQVRHAQKLETLGVLAGGIAHRFNNLLMVVLANAGMARRVSDQPERLAGHLEKICRGAEQAGELTQQLLVYSGRGVRRSEPVHLTGLVRDTLELLRVSIRGKATLDCQLAEELPPTQGDPDQLRQVLVNLTLNAAEVLGEEGGEVLLRTGVVQASSADLAAAIAAADTPPGTYVYLEVVDSGAGMDEDALARVFDPFYTTKATGRGLGLAAVRGIVKGHRGAIVIESRVGRGTRFRVLLPSAGEAPGRDEAAASEGDREAGGTLLLAEDELEVAEIVRLALEEAGYQVLHALDGREAVELHRENGSLIRLVILDLLMPRMSGLEALAEIRHVSPELPVVLASGLGAHGYQEVLDADPHTSFLGKPFEGDVLIEHLRERLASTRRG